MLNISMLNTKHIYNFKIFLTFINILKYRYILIFYVQIIFKCNLNVYFNAVYKYILYTT